MKSHFLFELGYQTTLEFYIKDAIGRDLSIVKFSKMGGSTTPVKSREYVVYGIERAARVTVSATSSQVKITPDEVTYFLYDHLGNTRVAFMSDTANGLWVVNALDYYSYGKILREYDNGAGDRYLTTGHERDRETGLDYRGARYYDSDVARFLSLDPLAAKYPALSPYNYVAGNPIKYIDPDGKKPLPVLNLPSPTWASQKGFYVHQQANDYGTYYLYNKGVIDFGTTVSLSKQLDRATEYADSKQFQNAESSFRHAMRNGDQTPEQAKKDADGFVRERFKWARYEFGQGNKEKAFFTLGVALHTIQDATSPAHGGFQEWTGEESKSEEIDHVIQELVYPGGESNLQKVTNDFLELFFSGKDLPSTNIFEYIQIDYKNEELKSTD